MTAFENGRGKTGGMCTKVKHAHIKIQKGRSIFFFIISFSFTRLISFTSGSLASLKKENQTKNLKEMLTVKLQILYSTLDYCFMGTSDSYTVPISVFHQKAKSVFQGNGYTEKNI